MPYNLLSQDLAVQSPDIYQWKGLIAKKANRTFVCLPKEHKRWIDPEDLLQEGLLAAYQAQQDFDSRPPTKGKKEKYGTYLYHALDWKNSKLAGAVQVQKRDCHGIVELDKPLETPNGEMYRDVADPEGTRQGNDQDHVNAFTTVFQAVGQRAKAVLLRGLVFGDTRLLTPGIALEIRTVCERYNVSFNDLKGIAGDEKIMRKVLTSAAQDRTLNTGTEEEDLRLLVCTDCQGKFSLAAVREGRFFVSTMTCMGCYKKLAIQKHSCFGKKFEPATRTECRLHCQDRQVCRQFVGEGSRMAKEDVLEGVDLTEAEAVAAEETPKKKKKVKKVAEPEPVAEKKTKKAKVVPVAEGKAEKKPAKKASGKSWWEKSAWDDMPEGLHGVAPYPEGSTFLYAFKLLARPGGIAREKLQRLLEKGGHNFKLLLRSMRAYKHKNHNWKLDEEGGNLKIYAIKYHGEHIKARVSAKKTVKESKPVAVETQKKKKKVKKVAEAA